MRGSYRIVERVLSSHLPASKSILELDGEFLSVKRRLSEHPRGRFVAVPLAGNGVAIPLQETLSKALLDAGLRALRLDAPPGLTFSELRFATPQFILKMQALRGVRRRSTETGTSRVSHPERRPAETS